MPIDMQKKRIERGTHTQTQTRPATHQEMVPSISCRFSVCPRLTFRPQLSPDPTTPAQFSQAMDSTAPEKTPNMAELDAPLHALGFQMEELSPSRVAGRLIVTPTCCQVSQFFPATTSARSLSIHICAAAATGLVADVRCYVPSRASSRSRSCTAACRRWWRRRWRVWARTWHRASAASRACSSASTTSAAPPPAKPSSRRPSPSTSADPPRSVPHPSLKRAIRVSCSVD
jgi:hypothetical protein